MNREEIFRRDDYRCVYCGEPFDADALTIDHVQPRVRGGDNSPGNVVTACGGCNTAKGHRKLAEVLLAESKARANFFTLARFVYPRHLRAVREEIAAREGRPRSPSS